MILKDLFFKHKINKNSRFYTDFCTPVSLGGNDITLEDRKKDIYPNNITLCKSNCKYSGVNIEERRVICSCIINNKTDDEVGVQNKENFLAYTIDYINYRLFLCYKLFFNAYYIRHSKAFFIIIIIYAIILIFDITFLNYSLKNLKKYLIKQNPSVDEIFKDISSEDKKSENNMNTTANKGAIANPLKKDSKKSKKENKLNKSKARTKRNKSVNILFINALNVKSDDEGLIKAEQPLKKETKKEKTERRLVKRRKSKKITSQTSLFNEKINKKEEEEKKEKEEEESINELPYTKALELDKRNIFHIYYSFLVEKLEFINIFCTGNRFKIILFIEYLLSLLINFFFNALLHSDEVVSHKYHNNGSLDILVSLVLSILSNIVTAILCS